jgi:hypothetical protein
MARPKPEDAPVTNQVRDADEIRSLMKTGDGRVLFRSGNRPATFRGRRLRDAGANAYQSDVPDAL